MALKVDLYLKEEHSLPTKSGWSTFSPVNVGTNLDFARFVYLCTLLNANPLIYSIKGMWVDFIISSELDYSSSSQVGGG